jgi:HSP20 family protein
MALVPFTRRQSGDLGKLHRDMDDWFGAFFGSWPTMAPERAVWPALDVSEDENAIVVKAEVPGCKADDIDISVHRNMLSISGEKKKEQENKEKGYYHLERSYGSFRRDINLPTDVDTGKIEAACKDGVLSVTVPKAEQAKAVKIKIKEQ